MKSGKEFPPWVNDAVAWERFVVDIEDHAGWSRGLPSPEESMSDDMSLILRGLEWNKVWLPTCMIVMMSERKRRSLLTKKKRMMRKMKNRMTRQGRRRARRKSQ